MFWIAELYLSHTNLLLRSENWCGGLVLGSASLRKGRVERLCCLCQTSSSDMREALWVLFPWRERESHCIPADLLLGPQLHSVVCRVQRNRAAFIWNYSLKSTSEQTLLWVNKILLYTWKLLLSMIFIKIIINVFRWILFLNWLAGFKKRNHFLKKAHLTVD